MQWVRWMTPCSAPSTALVNVDPALQGFWAGEKGKEKGSCSICFDSGQLWQGGWGLEAALSKMTSRGFMHFLKYEVSSAARSKMVLGQALVSIGCSRGNTYVSSGGWCRVFCIQAKSS